jgi:hypothetical protein
MKAPSPRDQRKLKNFLILPGFQLGLIGMNVSIIAITFTFFWVTAHNLLRGLSPAAGLSGIQLKFYEDYLEYHRGVFNRTFLFSSLLALVLSSTITLLVSHRLAGPFVRMKGFFGAINKGVYPIPRLAFRDGDFFQELPTIINEAITHIEERTISEKRRA